MARTRHRRPRTDPQPAGRRSGFDASGEQGIASLEMAILYPVILMMVLGMFQVSLYWHTANAAGRAAERGVEVGRVDGGDAEAATEAAQTMLSGTTRAADADVSTDITGELITVTVAADAPRLFGLLGRWRVRSAAQGRLEQFIPADER